MKSQEVPVEEKSKNIGGSGMQNKSNSAST